MRKDKQKIKITIKEVMTGNLNYGQGLGIGHPSTANAAETSPVGDLGAPVADWNELEDVKEEVQDKIMYLLKDYVNNTGDAYELLVLIKDDLEYKMSRQGYAETEAAIRREVPVRESRKRSKRSS